MEKLTERIGLYDLWAVFFPGIIGTLELLFFSGSFYCVYKKYSFFTMLNWIVFDRVTTWMIIILVSVFFGIVLQEIGRGVRIVTKFQNAEDVFLDPKAGVFTEDEYSFLQNPLAKYGWGEKGEISSKSVFHRLNAEAQECGVALKYAKLSVLQNMLLSLLSAMLVGAVLSIAILIFSIINGRVHITILMIALGIFCGLLVGIFYRRAIRFNRYWVRNLVYAMSNRQEGTGTTSGDKKC